MIKVLANKRIKHIVGVLLAVILAISMVPLASIAYGVAGDKSKGEANAEVIVGEDAEEEDSEEGPDDGIDIPDEDDDSNDVGGSDDLTPDDPDAAIMPAAVAETRAGSQSWVTASGGATAKVSGNEATVTGSGTITVNLSGSKSYKLTIDGNVTGDITVPSNTTLSLNGSGTLTGTGSGSVIVVKGTNNKLVLNEDRQNLTITGGTGTSVPSGFGGDNNSGLAIKGRAGGGVHVQRTSANTDTAHNPTFIMYGGTITGNTADAGGGIYVDRWCNFEMHGGTVSSNTAKKYEGGGIYTAAPNAVVSAGKIENNTTLTTTEWGGGGIFIESRGKVTIRTVTINNNTAGGLGGGIAGCPHAHIGIGEVTQGAAIYGNTAKKTGLGSGVGRPDNQYLYALQFDGSNNTAVPGYNGADTTTVDNNVLSYPKDGKTVSGDVYAYSQKFAGNAFTAEMASDFYCTRSSIVFGQTVSGLVDSSEVAWTGVYAGPEAKAGAKVQIMVGQTWAEGEYSVGLKAAANPSSVPQRDLMITGNTSYTHGGGIGCNGQLEIGNLTTHEVSSYGFSVEFEKELLGYDGTNILGQTTSQFDFELYDATKSKVVATATSDATGKVVFNVNEPDYAETGTYVFYAKELGTNGAAQDNITIDSAWHEVTVDIVKTTSTAVVGSASVTIHWSAVREGGITYGTGDEGKVFSNKVTPLEDTTYSPWVIEFEKRQLNGLNVNVLGSTQYEFGIYASQEDADAATNALATAKNTSQGDNNVRFEIPASATKDFPDTSEDGSGTEYTFYARELSSGGESIKYDNAIHTVTVTVKRTAATEPTYVDGDLTKPYLITNHAIVSGSVTYGDDEQGKAFVNKLELAGSLPLSIEKLFYGDTAEDGAFKFELRSIAAPDGDVADLSELEDAGTLLQTKSSGAFTGYVSRVEFDPIQFFDPDTATEGQQVGPAANNDQDEMFYWYMITEQQGDDDVFYDSRAYVIKVAVRVSDSGLGYEARIAQMFYAQDLDSELIELEREESAWPAMQFENFDTSMATMSLRGYSVNAASGESLEKCLVDPKIIKELIGRPLAEGEFTFKLVQVDDVTDGVPNWNQTSGPVISTAANDRYGMVDFDKANNKGTWENPTCLEFTQPGTYYYRVVEANETTDATVEYSQQIITFTAVIELNDGILQCTDMYYGEVDPATGENVRIVNDDPNFHPTMTNYAKGSDLRVRKTSALDRDNGLEGATYGLYAVNMGAQDDIFMGEASSDADGWITYKNVSLTEGQLYYFKERSAPAGHTVSEFRSAYFYITPDASAPYGYAMHYTDSKFDLGSPETSDKAVAVALSLDEGGLVAFDTDASGPTSDDGNMLFTFARDGGVYDEATLVEFNKLDTRTHEWVEGARLAIIDKSTGNTVNEWTSGQASERLEGVLNVDTTYILRELEAPEGYAKAADAEFTIGQYGAVSILSGTSNGNAEIQDSTITLYDTMLDVENVVTEHRETTSTDGGFPVKTGDLLKIGGVIALALLAAAGVMLIARKRRKPQH